MMKWFCVTIETHRHKLPSVRRERWVQATTPQWAVIHVLTALELEDRETIGTIHVSRGHDQKPDGVNELEVVRE